MKLALREATDPNTREVYVRGIVLLATSPEESLLLDRAFGDKMIDDDGLIGTREVECRLSDGFGGHYMYLKVPEKKGDDKSHVAVPERRN